MSCFTRRLLVRLIATNVSKRLSAIVPRSDVIHSRASDSSLFKHSSLQLQRVAVTARAAHPLS